MLMLIAQNWLFSWCPGVRLPGTFMYNWTVFIPRMTLPTCDNILLAETTRAKAGSFISSWSCGLHLRSSDKSRLVPNLIVFMPLFPRPLFSPWPRWYVPIESLESESESSRWPPNWLPLLFILSCSSFRLSWKLEAWYWAYLAMVVMDRCETQDQPRRPSAGSQFSSGGCCSWVRTSIGWSG